MSLLDAVPEGAVVGLDTAPIIYFLEEHADYGPLCFRSPGLVSRVARMAGSLST